MQGKRRPRPRERGGKGYQLNLGSNSVYRENTITNNTSGAAGTVLGGLDMGGNSCDGKMTCP
jgi:hypothetical protein